MKKDVETSIFFLFFERLLLLSRTTMENLNIS